VGVAALDNELVVFSCPGIWSSPPQLVSLSLTLGAFAAFFLVTGQRPEERVEFMNASLRDLRRVLLAYSIYRRARANAASWTGVPS
jgi:hypothetical protein